MVSSMHKPPKPRAAGFTKDGTAVAPDAPPLPHDPFSRLKEPFLPEQTKLGQLQPNGFQGTVVEWNYVCDRIEEIDPSWFHWIDVKYHGPVGNKMVVEITAHLTILNVTRLGHSAGAATSETIGDVAKRVETDALKRAATKFGVARYLYAGDSKTETAHKLTPGQVDNIKSEWGVTAAEKVSGLLGRSVDLDADAFTAAEVDIIFAAGGK